MSYLNALKPVLRSIPKVVWMSLAILLFVGLYLSLYAGPTRRQLDAVTERSRGWKDIQGDAVYTKAAERLKSDILACMKLVNGAAAVRGDIVRVEDVEQGCVRSQVEDIVLGDPEQARRLVAMADAVGMNVPDRLRADLVPINPSHDE